MPKGYGGNFSGGNMNNMLAKQAQKMKRQMEQMQEELEAKVLDITTGGGAVKISINGKREILSVTLDKSVVDPDDVEMLQDLLLTAFNEALRQVEELAGGEMSKITGGLSLPGLF